MLDISAIILKIRNQTYNVDLFTEFSLSRE